jgi:hypothetical protein
MSRSELVSIAFWLSGLRSKKAPVEAMLTTGLVISIRHSKTIWQYAREVVGVHPLRDGLTRQSDRFDDPRFGV